MKVNFIMPGLGNSGGMKVVYKYAKLLQKEDVDVKIYSSFFAYPAHKFQLKLVNYIYKTYCFIKTLFSFRSKKNEGVTWVPRINNKYIRTADVTVATAWPTAYEVNSLSQKCGKKAYFIQDYEIWDNEYLGMKSYTLPLKHIVIAKWIDNILVNELHLKPGYLVRNGMDTKSFIPEEKKKNSNKISCLMLYHKLSRKGIEDGIRAYRLVKDKYPNVSLNMFGMFKDPKIEIVDNYYRNPSKEQLIKLYQQSDIFIYPTREEGWGLTPLEAMACGCAVAGTYAGCMLELGVSGKNVLLSKPKDVKALAENISLLINDETLRKKLQKNGRTTVERLSWTESTNKLKKALIEIKNS